MSKILGIKSSLRERRGHALYDSISGVMLQGVLEKIKRISGFTTETINLAQLNLQPCRGCFSDMETRCHFLCDCYDDDFKMIAKKVMEADGVIFSTPTYMFGMSSVLKRFFERWISFKAPLIPEEEATKSLDECFELLDKLENGTLNASNPLQGKVGGVVVAGSELGQDNVAKEIMLILNLYGFILPPQCFIYHTGHSMQSLEDVRESFNKNQWLLMATENLARSMVQMIRLTAGQSWPQMEKILYKP
ncbi:MAG: flavodoxin family protein [Desulfobacteraceae bacterium]|nr:flavodoxin family protein [Desulfobacteraceae bacterium]